MNDIDDLDNLQQKQQQQQQQQQVGTQVGSQVGSLVGSQVGIDDNQQESTLAQNIRMYGQKSHFNKIFRIDKHKYSYVKPCKNGSDDDILHPKNIGKYSKKLEVMCNIIKNSIGLNLVYSQFKYYGCYLICLALEKIGYRRIGDQHLWNDDQIKNCPQLCSICNKYITEHTDDESHHQFRQARYMIAVGSQPTDDLTRMMNVLTRDDNIKGEIIKVIVGTSTISEGFDFKYIRYIHVFDPWYNYTRLEQLAGRGSRQGSHSIMKMELRNVTMLLYALYLSNDLIETQDIHNYTITLEKDIRIKNVERLMKISAVDCNVHLNHNLQLMFMENSSELYNYKRDCDYDQCRYSCIYDPFTVVLTLLESKLDEKSQNYVPGKYNARYNMYKKDEEIEVEEDIDIEVSSTVDDILKKLGFDNHVIIAFHSNNILDNGSQFIDQLNQLEQFVKDYNNNYKTIWIRVKKMRSESTSFWLYHHQNWVNHIISVIKYVIGKNQNKNYEEYSQMIFSMDQLMSLTSKYLSFDIRMTNTEKSLLYKHAMGLLSGFYVSPKYKILNFCVLPISINNKIYYILHPDHLLEKYKSIYYKHIWFKSTPSTKQYIHLNNWDKIVALPTTEKDDTLISNYISSINQLEKWNKYRLYSKFSQESNNKLSFMLKKLIDSSDSTNNINLLILYLVMFLKKRNIVHFTADPFQNNFEFIFNNTKYIIQSYMGKPNMIEDDVTIEFDRIPKPPIRNENKIAIGFYLPNTSRTEIQFKLKNQKWLSDVKTSGQCITKTSNVNKKCFPRGRSCNNYTHIKNDSAKDLGLYNIYQLLLTKAVELSQTKHTSDDYIPKSPQITFTGDKKNCNINYIGAKSSKKLNQNDCKKHLCEYIQYLLHYLDENDPDNYYFVYSDPDQIIGQEKSPSTTKTPISLKTTKRISKK